MSIAVRVEKLWNMDNFEAVCYLGKLGDLTAWVALVKCGGAMSCKVWTCWARKMFQCRWESRGRDGTGDPGTVSW